MVVSGQHHAPGKEAGAQWIGKRVGPTTDLDHLEKRKSLALPGFEPRIVKAESAVSMCTEISRLSKLINTVWKTGSIVTKILWPILSSYYQTHGTSSVLPRLKRCSAWDCSNQANSETLWLPSFSDSPNTPPHTHTHSASFNGSPAADISQSNYQLIIAHICFEVLHTGAKIQECLSVCLCYGHIAFPLCDSRSARFISAN